MASKTKSTFLTMTLTLLVVGVVASSLLAMIYKVTKEPIAKAEQAKKEKAIMQVVPKFDNSPFLDVYKIPVLDEDGKETSDSLTCFPAKNGDKIVGIAIETYTDKGFSGHFTVMVGFLPDGTIYNTAILSHKETPGLGDKMAKNKSLSFKKNKEGEVVDTLWWSKQFMNINLETFDLRVKKDGGEVDAITASTISSRAYCEAVDRAYQAFVKNIKK